MDGPFFLDSDAHGAGREPQQFEALGHAGSKHYKGLEIFPNPGCGVVQYTSDEVMAACPITGQPDFYTVAIQLRESPGLIESKSLKLWFQNLMTASLGQEGHGIFCEALAVHIRQQVFQAIDAWGQENGGPFFEEESITVQLDQKSRGGITIRAIA